MFDSDRRALTDGGVTDWAGASAPSNIPPQTPLGGLPSVPPHCPPELLERMGGDILARVEKLWPKRHHELGPCLVWTGARGPDAEKGPYGRMYDAGIGKTDYVHKVVWRRVYPGRPIPGGVEVDELCEIPLCVRPDHLDLKTKRDNVKRRGATRGPNKRVKDPIAEIQPKIDNSAATTTEFTIARFDRIDRPNVRSWTVTLSQLVTMLRKFEVLDDKRRGQCWSPTKYAAGATSRGNAGDEAVSALVFDCDRVPPDEKRLNGVRWIAHTTWSHRPEAPRWRVVIPLCAPVAASAWSDVWRRARAGLWPGSGPSVQGSKPRVLVAEPSGGGGARNELPPRSALGPAKLTRATAGTEGISRGRQSAEGQ
jgi:hypothetical protein